MRRRVGLFRLHRCLALASLVFGGASRLEAQSVLGTVSDARVLPLREQLETEIGLSRFRLGPIHLRPRLSLQGPAYTNNLLGTEGESAPDWTATVIGGLRYIVPIGTKFYIRGEESPSYYWALNARERRRFGFVNDTRLYALLGRVTIEGTGGLYRETVPLSSEDLQPVGITSTRFGIRSELETFGRFSLMGEVSGLRRRYDTAGATPSSAASISSLEGDDLSLRGGVKYRFSTSLMLGGSYERSTFRYVAAESRNNDEVGYVLTVQFQRRRLALNAQGGLREFRAVGNSTFPTFSGTTGVLLLNYELLRSLTLQVSATRNLVNSTYLANPYFVETRSGAGFTLQVGRRIRLHGMFEVGTNRYPLALDTAGDAPVARKDDVRVLRGELSIQVLRAVRILGGLSQTRYTSNLPGLGRSVLAFTTNIDFGGLDLIR